MNDLSLLSGRLAKRSLPLLAPGPGVAMPTLKRLALPQGELAQFHDGEPSIRYLAAFELLVSGVRGNHYHRTKVEHVYVVQGAMELAAQDLATGERVLVGLNAGDLAVIQPGIAHAYRVVRPGWAVEFAPSAFDPADIHPHPLTS
ncbi:MAG: hypothetical protein MUE94_10105 [Verrucomicrobia bacterium]|nr:hypothetical protein [Verrucomicrobiota bacterium]